MKSAQKVTSWQRLVEIAERSVKHSVRHSATRLCSLIKKKKNAMSRPFFLCDAPYEMTLDHAAAAARSFYAPA